MISKTSCRRRRVRALWVVALLGLGAVGCGNREVGTVNLAGKQPKIYVQTVSRTKSTPARGRRLAIDRLPRKSVKHFAFNTPRSS